MTDLVTPTELSRLASILRGLLPSFMADLERFVNVDCGSYTKAGVDEVGAWSRRRSRSSAHGSRSRPTPSRMGIRWPVSWAMAMPRARRSCSSGTWTRCSSRARWLQRPFRTEGGRALGPGVSDMKGGLLAGLYALRALRTLASEEGRAADWLPVGRLVYVANPDEETGRP
ncbi:MAG: M20/M25/M40 family metallo-hydrolase [Chloroflexota bacterium]